MFICYVFFHMAFLCCVEVGKVKFNEAIFLHTKGKWDDEGDVPQSIGGTRGFFFLSIRMRSKL